MGVLTQWAWPSSLFWAPDVGFGTRHATTCSSVQRMLPYIAQCSSAIELPHWFVGFVRNTKRTLDAANYSSQKVHRFKCWTHRPSWSHKSWVARVCVDEVCFQSLAIERVLSVKYVQRIDDVRNFIVGHFEVIYSAVQTSLFHIYAMFTYITHQGQLIYWNMSKICNPKRSWVEILYQVHRVRQNDTYL